MAGESAGEFASELIWVERCLPAASRRRRLEIAADCDLTLEIADADALTQADREAYRELDLRVAVVQGYRLHDTHALDPDEAVRKKAPGIVEAACEIAQDLGARRLVTVAGFGDEVAPEPAKAIRSFYEALIPLAERTGLRMLIEPLSPRRCSVFNTPGEALDLLAELNRPDLFGLLLDTGHLLDGGFDPFLVLSELEVPCEELQLRGPMSTPPPLEWDYRDLLSRLNTPPAVVSVEFHGQQELPDFWALLSRVRSAIGRT